MKPQLTEGKDYHILADGRLVFTATYLQERGYCCGNGCMNCPYEYMNVKEPYRSQLIQNRDQRDLKG